MSSALVNAAGSVRPSGGSAQQDTKLYLPTGGRPAEFVGIVDVVVLVFDWVEVEVEVLDEVVEDEEEVVEDGEVVVEWVEVVAVVVIDDELDDADLSR
jgi:hypothetical protein